MNVGKLKHFIDAIDDREHKKVSTGCCFTTSLDSPQFAYVSLTRGSTKKAIKYRQLKVCLLAFSKAFQVSSDRWLYVCSLEKVERCS